MVENFSYF